ncbi:dihydrodipicolinate synthase family protein [Culicoidibacter larvae]|nr:dihydrodipicolinate synthase family protein [Culicoidibacter larvae]
MGVFNRIAVALVTPFNTLGEVDSKRLQQLVEWHIHEGIETFLLNSITAEARSLQDEELQEVISSVVSVAQGRAKVIVALDEGHVATAAQFIIDAEISGVDAILLSMPDVFLSDASGARQYVEYVVDHTNMPIILHFDGMQHSYDYDALDFLPLVELPRVSGVNVTNVDLEYVNNLVNLLPESCAFYSSDEHLLVPYMAMGFAGVFSSVANLYPKVVQQLASLAEQEDYAALRSQARTIFLLNEALSDVAGIKAALNITGISVGDVRLPLTKKPTEVTRYIKDLLEEIEADALFPTD